MSSHQQDVRPGGRVLRFCTSSHSRQDWFPPSGVSPWSGPGTPRPAASATAQTKTWSASPQAVVALGHLWVYLPHFRLLSSGLPLATAPAGPQASTSLSPAPSTPVSHQQPLPAWVSGPCATLVPWVWEGTGPPFLLSCFLGLEHSSSPVPGQVPPVLQASVLTSLPGRHFSGPVLSFPWLVKPLYHALFSLPVLHSPVSCHCVPSSLDQSLGWAAAREMWTVGVLDRPPGWLD